MANTLKFGNGEWYGKKDTILAYNDENNNYKPLPFDFSRGSSATVINKDGLIETVGSGQPRIDYKDDSKGALLLEPSRTNSLVQSNQFDTTWSASSGMSLTSGQIGIGGSNDAWLVTRDSAYDNLYQSNSSFFTNTSTISIYAKANTYNFLRFAIAGVSEQAYFNLVDGTLGVNTSLISSYSQDMGNGWWRLSATFQNNSAAGIYIQPVPSDGGVSVGGTGSIYIQYAQLEVGSYATSYIPTQGSVVTRLGDNTHADIPSSAAGQLEGTLYVEMNFMNNFNEYPSVYLWSGSPNNRVLIQRRGNNKFLQCQISKTGQSTISLMGNTVVSDGIHKMAFTYSPNRLVGYVDGVKFDEQLGSFTTYTNELNRVDLLYNDAQAGIKDLKLYNTALTDQELQALTSN